MFSGKVGIWFISSLTPVHSLEMVCVRDWGLVSSPLPLDFLSSRMHWGLN